MKPSDLNPELRGTQMAVLPPEVFAKAQKIEPVGPRLNLVAVMAFILVDMPDELTPEKVGDIHLPANYQKPIQSWQTLVKVLSVGPDVKTVKVGDSVLVNRAQAEAAWHDGHVYHRLTEQSVIGIVRRGDITN